MVDFTLQLFHAADQEAGIPALEDVPRFSAVLNALKAQDIDGDGTAGFANTLLLSSGDAYISGPFLRASDAVYGGAGRGDILIQNALGFQAIALGNHEFDQGTAQLRDLIAGDDTFAGTAFPYLSGNLDFSADSNLADLVVPDGQAPLPNSIAASTVIEVNGERIGVVGATTPILLSIANAGDVTVLPQIFDGNPTPAQLDALAAEIQADVDALLSANPDVNKVVLLAHMQQLSIEQDLAQRLSNVDIIVAGGSHTRLSDANDRPRADAVDSPGIYPIIQTDRDGNPVAVVNTDSNYRYVGRLVIGFDANGVLLPETYDPTISGAYATDDLGVAAVGGAGLADPAIVAITDALRAEIESTESNVFGASNVYLNGLRRSVRIEETNLGNLTADANLAAAREADPTVVISFKNGGGIRDSIGRILVPGGGTGDPEFLPTAETPGLKPAGGISQLDIENTLRFNNELSLITVTAAELLAIVEHGISGLQPDGSASPGAFPQISGFAFSFDVTRPVGNRVQSLALEAPDGTDLDVIVRDGEIVGDPSRTFRMVTLRFLAEGGDGYPFPTGEAANRVDLVDETAPRTGAATFAADFSEQDALAEYLAANFGATSPYAVAETGRDLDSRIQNLAFRADGVIDSVNRIGVGSGARATLLDLRDIAGPVATSFTVNREAAYTNFAGFYRIADLDGGIDIDGDGEADLAPGQAGYTEAAINARTEAVNLTTPNNRTSVFRADVAGGSFYAPFLITQGTIESYNASRVYFSFAAANADGVEHIRYRNGALEFEDLFGGGDNDFNDFVINVAVTI